MRYIISAMIAAFLFTAMPIDSTYASDKLKYAAWKDAKMARKAAHRARKCQRKPWKWYCKNRRVKYSGKGIYEGKVRYRSRSRYYDVPEVVDER